MQKYPTLEGEISRRGIKKKAIASALKISPKALSNKLTGKTPFTWPEACKTQEVFFPDVEMQRLFSDHPPDSR